MLNHQCSAFSVGMLNHGLQLDKRVFLEHSRQWFKRHLFHAGRRSVV